MKLSASLALWNEVLASETAADWSSLCWAMSWAHREKADFAAEKTGIVLPGSMDG